MVSTTRASGNNRRANWRKLARRYLERLRVFGDLFNMFLLVFRLGVGAMKWSFEMVLECFIEMVLGSQCSFLCRSKSLTSRGWPFAPWRRWRKFTSGRGSLVFAGCLCLFFTVFFCLTLFEGSILKGIIGSATPRKPLNSLLNRIDIGVVPDKSKKEGWRIFVNEIEPQMTTWLPCLALTWWCCLWFLHTFWPYYDMIDHFAMIVYPFMFGGAALKPAAQVGSLLPLCGSGSGGRGLCETGAWDAQEESGSQAKDAISREGSKALGDFGPATQEILVKPLLFGWIFGWWLMLRDKGTSILYLRTIGTCLFCLDGSLDVWMMYGALKI